MATTPGIPTSRVSSTELSSMTSQMITPTIAPTSGNRTNAHSCSSAPVSGSAKSAVAMLRAGFTEVLSTGIATRCTRVSVTPTTRPPMPAGIRPPVDAASTTTTSNAVSTISTTMAEPSPAY